VLKAIDSVKEWRTWHGKKKICDGS